VTPSSGSGWSQTFQFVFSDPNGWRDIRGTVIHFATPLDSTLSCYMYFETGTRTLWLANDDGSVWMPGVLGGPSILENSRCKISLASANAAGSGIKVTLTLPLIFKNPFLGTKYIYLLAEDLGGLHTGWRYQGTWVVTAQNNQAPVVVGSSPMNGRGSAQSFVFRFGDPNGYEDLRAVVVTFATPLSSDSCYLYYDRAGNTLWLASDDGRVWTPGRLGSSYSLQNSLCEVALSASVATGSGSGLDLTLVLSFKSAFLGTKSVYALAEDGAGVNTGWRYQGTWTVTPVSNQPPAVLGVTPNSGHGTTQTFAVAFSDPNGYADLRGGVFQFVRVGSQGEVCYIYLDRAFRTIWLASDDGRSWTPGALGGDGVLTNSRCAVSLAASRLAESGTTATLTLALSFASSFTGSHTILGLAEDGSGSHTGWQNLGVWTVP
jgi:hypothetical protein